MRIEVGMPLPAFGDDIAIECLRDLCAHGSDAMVDEENCVFFLPHCPRSEICEPPFFLFMKGWCAAGADHYKPLVASPSAYASQEKVIASGRIPDPGSIKANDSTILDVPLNIPRSVH